MTLGRTLLSAERQTYNIGFIGMGKVCREIWCTNFAPHGAGTHSIEGKKWQEKAGHFAGDFWKRLALMVTKWDSYRRVHVRNWHQNFFRVTRGQLAGRSIEHSKRYWLCFGSRAGYQNFRAFFRATLKTSRRFSTEICYIERGQCCPPIYLTSAKQHAKKKRILVLTCP